MKKTRKTRTARAASKKKQKARECERAVLFAPWRLEFIQAPKARTCFLCEASQLKSGGEAAWKRMLLLYRDAHVLVMLNRYPYIGGHLLIAPRRHTADLSGLSEAESRGLWECSRRALGILKEHLRPQGFNLGMNLGKAGGAGVEDHLHMHALPRWVGDTNFLPVVGGTHTIPVALCALWKALRPAFKDH